MRFGWAEAESQENEEGENELVQDEEGLSTNKEGELSQNSN